jgi:hypothetical protein
MAEPAAPDDRLRHLSLGAGAKPWAGLAVQSGSAQHGVTSATGQFAVYAPPGAVDIDLADAAAGHVAQKIVRATNGVNHVTIDAAPAWSVRQASTISVATLVAGFPVFPGRLTAVLQRNPPVNTGTCTDQQQGTVAVLATRRANVSFANPPVDGRYCSGHYLITLSDASGPVTTEPIAIP